jgi:hypothetical protein
LYYAFEFGRQIGYASNNYVNQEVSILCMSTTLYNEVK